MSSIVPKDEVNTALEILKDYGEDAYVIGQIIEGEEKTLFAKWTA